jgi:hypothetical protein
MEISQGNSLCSYLKQTKMSFFSLQNWRTGVWNSPASGGGTSERGEEVEKGHGRVNLVQILCAHVHKWKNELAVC